MIKWKKFNGKKKEWNDIVVKFNGNYRQFWEWGDYKLERKWEIYRYLGFKNNKVTYSAQLIIKKYWPFCLVYIPGGVSSEFENGYCLGIEKFVYRLLKFFFIIIRIDSNYNFSDEIEKKFKRNNWTKPFFNLNTGVTCNISLVNVNDDNCLPKASSKWKYNLRRSLRNNLSFFIEQNPLKSEKEIIQVSQEMIKFKKITIDNPNNVIKISKYFDKNIIIIKCLSDKGEMLGFRSALVLHKRAWDIYAATNSLGRKFKAGYPLLKNLIYECKLRGAMSYNLPLGTKKDIFKIETGGHLYKFVGEWEHTNFMPLKFFFNYALYIRKSNNKLIKKIVSFIKY